MKRLVMLFLALTATMGCALPLPEPVIMTRPASVEAGGLDCVRVTLQRLGYMITAGDRSLGFVRAERKRAQTVSAGLLTTMLITDALLVNYINAGTVDDSSDNVIHVKVSRVGGAGLGPTPEAVSDAEQLLARCGKP